MRVGGSGRPPDDPTEGACAGRGARLLQVRPMGTVVAAWATCRPALVSRARSAERLMAMPTVASGALEGIPVLSGHTAPPPTDGRSMSDRRERLRAEIDRMVKEANKAEPLTGELALAVAFWIHGQRLLIEAVNPDASQLLRDLALRPALESLLRANAIACYPESVAEIVKRDVGGLGRGRWFGKSGFLSSDDRRRAAYEASLREWAEALAVDDVQDIDDSGGVWRRGIDEKLWVEVESARQQLSHLQIHPSIDAIRVYLTSETPPRLVASPEEFMLSQQTLAVVGQIADIALASVSEFVENSR